MEIVVDLNFSYTITSLYLSSHHGDMYIFLPPMIAIIKSRIKILNNTYLDTYIHMYTLHI